MKWTKVIGLCRLSFVFTNLACLSSSVSLSLLSLSCSFHPSLHCLPLSVSHVALLLKHTIALLLKCTIIYPSFTIHTCDAPTTMYHRLCVLLFMLRAQKNLKGLSIIFYHLPSDQLVWGLLRLAPIKKIINFKKRLGIVKNYLNKMKILIMNSIIFKIRILTVTNSILLLYDNSQNRDLKCNRTHYQYLHLV